MAVNEWTNYGDASFFDYGGIMVQTIPYDSYTDFRFFELKISAEGEKFAIQGTVCGLEDYAKGDYAKDLDKAAKERGFKSGLDMIETAPEEAVVALLEGYGYGALEFSPRNHNGEGEYSLDLGDFKCTDEELVDFMSKEDIPSQFIPTLRYHVSSYYGDNYSGLEDDLRANEWDEVVTFAHEKLMNGGYVEIEDVLDGQSVRVDPDRYINAFDGEFLVNPQYMTVDYGDGLDDL